MYENKIIRRVDRYIRKRDTIFARSLQQLCALKGKEYRVSTIKKRYEHPIRKTILLFSRPIVSYLANQAVKETGGNGFYLSERMRSDGSIFMMRKIQTMRDGSDKDPLRMHHMAALYTSEDHPHNTSFGRRIRTFELDELPQLEDEENLALVEMRAATPGTSLYIWEKRGDSIAESWERDYRIAPKPGIFNLTALISPRRKDDTYRPRAELFYAEHANVNLDTYIILGTGLYIMDKVLTKISQKLAYFRT